MFEILAISIAFMGSVVAGIWDLLTTEVPDEVPALMIALGIFNWFVYASSSGDPNPLFISLLTGTSLLVFGLVLYRSGHWGGADAWLLAAIGYNIPFFAARIFIFDFLFNFLIVGSVYMVIYAFVLGILNRNVFSYFVVDVKDNWKPLALISLACILAIYMLYNYLPQRFGNMAWVIGLLIFLVFFWRYAKVIENRVFRKRIRTSQLKVGDVTEDMLWRGITAEEIKQLIKKKKYVIIKEGVRFIPVFSVALVVTLLFGNLMFLIL